MLLEVRSVGRKTPKDGKLEVTVETARRLRLLGTTLPLVVGAQTSVALVESMPCGCARGGAGHEHYFVSSELLRQLPEGETVCLEITAGGVLEIARPHALEP
jgi:hypothetical protein